MASTKTDTPSATAGAHEDVITQTFKSLQYVPLYCHEHDPTEDLTALDEEELLHRCLEYQADVVAMKENVELAHVAGEMGLTLHKNHAEAIHKVQELEGELTQVRAENDELKVKYDSLKKSLESSGQSEEVMALSETIASLTSELKKLREREIQHTQELQDAINENAKVREVMSNRVEQLKWENNYLAGSVRQLEAERVQRSPAAADDDHESHAGGAEEKEEKQGQAGGEGAEAQTQTVSEKKKSSILKKFGKTKKKIGKRFTSFTLNRNAMRDHEDRIVVAEVVSWMERVVGRPLVEDGENMEDVDKFRIGLQNGLVLCDLLKGIDSSISIGKTHKNAKPGSFFAHDNVHSFLDGCKKMGIPDHLLFTSTDLLGSPVHTRLVCTCLLALARAAIPFGITPPDIVTMEIEIDRQRAEEHTRVRFHSAPPNAQQVAASVAASHADAAAAEEVPVPTSNLDSNGKYVPVASDEVDVQLAEIVNAFSLDQKLMPVRHAEGQYQFGRNAVVYMRMVRGVCLVRCRGEWVTLDKFIGDLVGESEEERIKRQREKAEVRAADLGTAAGAAAAETESSAAGTGTDTATADGGSAEPSAASVAAEEEEKRSSRLKAQQFGAHREFFFLTCLAVKMNHVLHTEDICQVSNEKLFAQALDEGVPFHKFYGWIEKEITKAYLAALMDARNTTRYSVSRGPDAVPGAGSRGLRENRAHIMKQLRARQYSGQDEDIMS